MNRVPRLRIGMMVDAPTVDSALLGLVEYCCAHPALELTLVVHPPPATAGAYARLARAQKWIQRRGLAALLGKLVFHALSRGERWALTRLGALSPNPACDARALGVRSVTVSPQLSPSGFVYRFSTADLERLRACNFDVLLRFGSGILRGEILQLPRFGVLSLHHGDNLNNRGGPPGYWEVLERQDASGYIIQRLTEELDGGAVLDRGWLRTRPPFARNQALLLRESMPALERLLDRLARERRLPGAELPLPYIHPLRRSPGVRDSLRYVLDQSRLWSGIAWRRLSGKVARWGVGVQPRRWREAVFWRATIVPNPPGRFLADPFVITHQGQTCLFVEDYDFTAGKGVISVYALSNVARPGAGVGATGEQVQIKSLGVAIEEPFHLSYPFLFLWQDQLYMCPETQEKREVRVYRCVDFPLRWELASVLMRDIDMVDSMLFERAGQWWLLGNRLPGTQTRARDASFSELHAFRAADPLSTDWIAHPANPLITDSRRGRNGGYLQSAGETVSDAGLYRVSQRYGFDRYGASADIWRVTQLDEQGYAEQHVMQLTPSFEPGLSACHHLHSDGDWTVFDFLRYERS